MSAPGHCAACGNLITVGNHDAPLVCGCCAHKLMKAEHVLAEINPGAWQDLGKPGELEREAWDEYHDWRRHA